MWESGCISIEVSVVDEEVMLVEIATPVGTMEVLGNVTRVGRVLYIRKADMDGLYRGALGRSGLNAICQKIMEEADVDQIVIEGGTRSTGKNRGRIPKPFRYP
jgi:hypothetical protein